MTERNFLTMLRAKWAEEKFVCVGLDTDLEKIPPDLRFPGITETMYGYNSAIVNATKDLVCAYKPNLAFYLHRGVSGIQALIETVAYIRNTAPDVPVILDAKFADIGNTNKGYAGFAYDTCGADAVTLHPYLGQEALKPFLDRKDKGCIILCRTSNPGGGEFQDLEIRHDQCQDMHQLFRDLANRVARYWNQNGNCCLVAGATYPDELALIRKVAGEIPLLIPGIGKQGGDLEKTVRAGMDLRGQGMIINSSRGIIFASSGEDFAVRAREETQKLHDEINRIRNEARS